MAITYRWPANCWRITMPKICISNASLNQMQPQQSHTQRRKCSRRNWRWRNVWWILVVASQHFDSILASENCKKKIYPLNETKATRHTRTHNAMTQEKEFCGCLCKTFRNVCQHNFHHIEYLWIMRKNKVISHLTIFAFHSDALLLSLLKCIELIGFGDSLQFPLDSSTLYIDDDTEENSQRIVSTPPLSMLCSKPSTTMRSEKETTFSTRENSILVSHKLNNRIVLRATAAPTMTDGWQNEKKQKRKCLILMIFGYCFHSPSIFHWLAWPFVLMASEQNIYHKEINKKNWKYSASLSFLAQSAWVWVIERVNVYKCSLTQTSTHSTHMSYALIVDPHWSFAFAEHYFVA